MFIVLFVPLMSYFTEFQICGMGTFAFGILVAQDDGRFLLFRLISPDSGILTHVAISMLGIGIAVIGSSFVGCTVASRKCSIGWVREIFGEKVL